MKQLAQLPLGNSLEVQNFLLHLASVQQEGMKSWKSFYTVESNANIKTQIYLVFTQLHASETKYFLNLNTSQILQYSYYKLMF